MTNSLEKKPINRKTKKMSNCVICSDPGIWEVTFEHDGIIHARYYCDAHVNEATEA